MGVRGLTSFIARRAELYLQPFELHDSYLVIDGDNLACCIYKDATGICSAFGGDYDDYYRAVVQFFQVLAECNVRPIVLMDGGYEQKKLRTVAARLRGKISVIKRINPCGPVSVFPVLMKDVFVDAVRDCEVPVMRCVFEADEELAALGRKLNCPVLSYDSDFYIYNVRYIPIVTLTLKTHIKKVQSEGNAKNGENVERKLRRNEVRKLEKRTKANRILSEIQVNAVEKHAPRRGRTYKYLDCCIYKIENLIARDSLSKEKLPLFAALLGNDYIARSCFKGFFVSGGRGRKPEQQQRRIKVILQWLKNESAEMALKKIMHRLKKVQRESLKAQVDAAISGYSNEKCYSYDYLVEHYKNPFDNFFDTNDSDEEQACERDGKQMPNIDECSDEGESVNGNEYSVENYEEANIPLDNAKESFAGEADGHRINSIEETDGKQDDNDENYNQLYKTKEFSAWFLEKLYPAELPRFCVDLIYLKKYINSPQIEHFPHHDCNEIALPILIYIFTLLYNAKDGDNSTNHELQDGRVQNESKSEKSSIEFTYLTRSVRVTNIRYYHYKIGKPPKYAFEPRSPNPLLLQLLFEDTITHVDIVDLFSQLQKLPTDLRLYFLAIVYWLHKSQHCDILHLHAIIICVVVLRTVDAMIPAERDLKDFQKRFGKIIKKERLVRAKETTESNKRGIKDELKSLPIPERMPFITKSDCLLVQDNLLKHFHMQEIFKKKYDLYSTTILHAFAEFQCVVFQLQALNALLSFPLARARMGQSYCGVFLYNIYDLLRGRPDVNYYIQHFIFQDSCMMFDFYSFLLTWCKRFVPHWKRLEPQSKQNAKRRRKRIRKKRHQAKRSQAAKAVALDPIAAELGESDDVPDFKDLNYIFCTLVKVR